MTDPTTFSAGIPVGQPTPVTTYSPVILEVPRRAAPLETKVSTPATGGDLPVLLLSHGHGNSNNLSSLYGYGPVANFWAAHGFAVLQPTHLDSKTLGLDPTGPEGPLFWRSRAEDMHTILDRLDDVEATVPGLPGRLDRDRVVVVGHSLGGHTGAMLLGMGVTDPSTGDRVDLTDPRVTAGVLMAPPGSGEGLAEFAAQHFPVLERPDFTGMTAPALVIRGDKDVNPRFSDRLDYRADAYFLSPGPKALFTVFGGEHGLGGVGGYDGLETTDEDPGRMAVVAAMTWAYLRSRLFPGDSAWADAVSALGASDSPPGRVESKEG